MRFAIVFAAVVLTAAPVSASFDWNLLVTESLLATDVWQTEEVYRYTSAAPRCHQVAPNEQICFYEGNPFLAGREWEQVENHMRLTPVAIDAVLPDGKLKQSVMAVQFALQVYSVFSNNAVLREIGMSPRYMLAYRWVW